MKYGFILADTYTGSSVEVESLVASLFPENGKDVLFFFSGGRLSKKTGTGMLRNSVYEFVRKENIDASVVWMSSLTGDLTPEEATNRLSHLNEIPYVTIAGKNNPKTDNPDVSFDAYTGMKEMVSHCIEKHGATKIAFICGPENHVSSMERFHGYLDALKEHGITPDERLISSPMDWSEGAKAIEQLIVERKLSPVKDFDLLVCASDYMLYNALKNMGKLCKIQDVMNLHFCGFNDATDAKRLSIPCTTVSLPFREMVTKAFSTLGDMINNKPVEKTIRLNTVPVIRKSCGCSGFHSDISFITLEDFFQFASSTCCCDKETFKKAFMEAYNNGLESSIRSLTELMCSCSKDYYDTNEVIEMIAKLDFLDKNLRDRLFSGMRYIMPEEMSRIFQKRYIKDKELQERLDHFKSRLLEANTLKEIAQILKTATMEIGISESYLVINRQDNQVLVGDSQNIEFANDLVLPTKIQNSLTPGSYVVTSLFTEEEIHGHLVLKTPQLMGVICEEIRSAVSSAVKSCLLFEQVNKSKQMLEKAEHDRLLFFSSINNNLRDPISQISEIVDETDGIAESARLRIHKSLTQSNRIIDLALSHTGELEVSFQVLDMNQVLQSVKGYKQDCELPCLFIDPSRLEEAFSVLSSEAQEIRAELRINGLAITCLGVSPESANDPYFNEMILLHGGQILYTENGCTVVLPYPTLSNKRAQTFASGTLACFGTQTTIEIPGLSKRFVDVEDFLISKKLPTETKAILWSKDFHTKEAKDCLRILESDDAFSRLPIIAFGFEWAQSLSEAFTKVLGTEEYRLVVSNDLPKTCYSWLTEANIMSSDLGKLSDYCSKVHPSMIMVPNSENIHTIIKSIRNNSETSSIPVIIATDEVESEFVNRIQEIPKVIICNKSLLDNENIRARISSILRGSDMLPVYSGNTVKKVQAFLCSNYMNQISRWQVAEAVHVSEDYLTSIFKRELGISPWDYLNRFRIEIATKLLQTTGYSMSEVARRTGFQGQAYFCTVFKKIKGFSPSLIRKQ